MGVENSLTNVLIFFCFISQYLLSSYEEKTPIFYLGGVI